MHTTYPCIFMTKIKIVKIKGISSVHSAIFEAVKVKSFLIYAHILKYYSCFFLFNQQKLSKSKTFKTLKHPSSSKQKMIHLHKYFLDGRLCKVLFPMP